MKKVININFQGTIIPIEETAYEILRKYSDSLRRHFANEEGRDEIINDIETRISELFSETLKKGSTCITDDDVNAVINSMGRPEDFDADGDINMETNTSPQNITHKTFEAKNTETIHSDSKEQEQNNASHDNNQNRRLYRDENHKILGGVCSGIANYFSVDPVIVRIIAIIFFSVALIPYIVIWIVIPSTATKVIGSPRKRLFRDTDNKKIAGVCSGIAQYFGVSTKIVRILFLLPFISIAFRMNHMFGWSFPHFLSLSFSPAATISYIILWILVPEAKSTSDKLEMQGKPVDLNSIKDTVQNDLSDFKEKAHRWSKDVSGTTKKWGDDISNVAQNMTKNNSENTTSESSSSQGFISENEENYTDPQSGNNTARKEVKSGIPTALKVLGYIILGLIITPILLSLFGVGIGFMAVLPATDFVLKNGWETILSWGTFFFFIWVPIIGIILWFFRLITRSRGGSKVIKGTFITLWIIGWICFFGLFSMVGRDFSHSAYTSPTTFDYKDKNVKTMIVTSHPKDAYSDWDNQDFNDFLRYFGNDSIKIPNVAVKIEASKDNNYHVESVGYANGESKEEANILASKIAYNFDQKDSLLFIPTDFFVNRNDKFRNQRIMIKIFVPIGKQILVKGDVNIRHNIDFNIGPMGMHRNNWDNSDNYWDFDVVYVMTNEGLKTINDNTKEDNPDQKSKKAQKDQNQTSPKTTDKDEQNDEENNEESAKVSTENKTTNKRNFAFFSVASLLSNKFSL